MLEKNSWGLALQTGFDVRRKRNWPIRLNMKKAQIRSKVSMAGEQISRVKLDPVLFGMGVDYRF